VQVAPAFGEAALALERRAAAVPAHQIHRLARAVGGVGRGQAAAGALLECVSSPAATVFHNSVIIAVR